MNLLPPLSQCVLTDLAACLLEPGDRVGETSPVWRAFVELTALLVAQKAA